MRFALLASIALTLISFNCRAGTIAVLTNQPGATVAKEFIDLIKTTPPFSRMPGLQVKLVYKESFKCDPPKDAEAKFKPSLPNPGTTPATLSPTSAPAVALPPPSPFPPSCQAPSIKAGLEKSLKRLFICTNYLELATIKAENNADFMVFVVDSSSYGGSGGGIPVMTTSSHATAGLHELLHTMGFADAYAYSTQCEADMYCRSGRKYANITQFEDPSPVSSEAEARKLYAAQIPWFDKIKRSTEITSGTQLGRQQGDDTGLYIAKTCSLASGKLRSWQPDSRLSVMEKLTTNYIPEATWGTIGTALGEKISARPGRSEKIFVRPDWGNVVKPAPTATTTQQKSVR